VLGLCSDVISGQYPHSTWKINEKTHDSFPVTK
jgi:hypothetical protein